MRYRISPPALRALGLDRELAVPARFRPGLAALAKARRLRGTPLDPFGRAEVRRVERAPAAEHTALVDQQTASLTRRRTTGRWRWPTRPSRCGATRTSSCAVARYRETVAGLLAG